MNPKAGSPSRQRRSGLPVEFAQAPMRTVRTKDAAAVYAHPRSQMRRLMQLGLLHRAAVGYYVVVPQDRVGSPWLPSIEATAAGIATAAVGAGQAILMGLTAARLHNAIPRALSTAIVAVPGDRRPIALQDRDGVVRFVQRDVEVLDAELVSTDLGDCLVTTPEQTVLDLMHRPGLGDAELEAHSAATDLLSRCDEGTLERIAVEQRLRAALERVRLDPR